MVTVGHHRPKGLACRRYPLEGRSVLALNAPAPTNLDELSQGPPVMVTIVTMDLNACIAKVQTSPIGRARKLSPFEAQPKEGKRGKKASRGYGLHAVSILFGRDALDRAASSQFADTRCLAASFTPTPMRPRWGPDRTPILIGFASVLIGFASGSVWKK